MRHPLLTAGLLWLKSTRPRFIDTGSKVPDLPPSGILALWHEHMLLCLPAFAHRNIEVIISQSRDGDWGTAAAQYFGYRVVRGSSTRGGTDALRHLSHRLAIHGGWAVLVVDGPRGPRRISKPGATILSKLTGLPVVTVTAHATPSFRLNSWDQCVVPLPFAKVSLKLSAPFYPERAEEVDRALKAHADKP